MKIRKVLANAAAIAVLCVAVAGLIPGCGKSDPGSSINKAVEDLSGKTQRDVGNMLKKQINVQSQQQMEQAKQNEDPEEGNDEGKGKE